MTGGWQGFVEVNMLGTGACAQAAVLGREGGVLAAGGGLSLTPEEQAAAVGAFTDPARTRAAGLRLGGRAYTVLALTDQSVRLATEGGGAVLARSGTVLLLAVYRDPVELFACSYVVEGLADHLIATGR